MKNTRNFITLVCMLLFINCFLSQAQGISAENGNSDILQKSGLKKDSVSTVKKPTSEDLDNLDISMAQNLTTLKYNPSTKQSKISYAFDNAGSVAKLVLYYQNNRLIRLEKCIYDQSNTQTSYSMFNFDEKNGCFSNTQWNLKDAMKRVLTMSEYGLIYFGTDMKLIELDTIQMQKFIKETKDSLDEMMGHFKDFKYSFEIK